MRLPYLSPPYPDSNPSTVKITVEEDSEANVFLNELVAFKDDPINEGYLPVFQTSKFISLVGIHNLIFCSILFVCFLSKIVTNSHTSCYSRSFLVLFFNEVFTLFIKILFIVGTKMVEDFGSALLDGGFGVFKDIAKFLEEGRRPYGYEIIFKKNITKKSEYYTKLYTVKEKSPDHLQLLNPVQPIINYYEEGSFFKLKPDPNYFGETEIRIRPVVRKFTVD